MQYQLQLIYTIILFVPYLAAVKPSLDLGFVIGASVSKGIQLLRTQSKILKHMLKSYDIAPGKTHVGIVQMGKVPRVAINFDWYTYLLPLEAAVDHLSLNIINFGVNNDGKLRDALFVANDKLFTSSYGSRPGFKKSLVVFVNKKLDEDTKALEEVGKSLKKNNINVIVIGLNKEADNDKLKAISPLNHLFFFPPLLDELDIALYPVVRSTYPGMIS